MMKNKTQKGFTLIELLMVVALIAILSTLILVMLDSGREKAEVNRYISYAAQMHRLVADTAASGQFDSGKIGNIAQGGNAVSYCLGDPDYDCGKSPLAATGTEEPATIYKALTYLTDMPPATRENSESPYAAGQGVYMQYKPTGNLDGIRIVMPLGIEDDAYVLKICNSIKWTQSSSGSDCYVDVKLHSRL